MTGLVGGADPIGPNLLVGGDDLLEDEGTAAFSIRVILLGKDVVPVGHFVQGRRRGQSEDLVVLL